MGWTGTHWPGGSLEDFFRKEFSDCEFLGTARKGNVFYAAIRSEKYPVVRALVVVCKFSRNEITYKDMGEDMGPYYYGCPNKILDILGPPCNKWAEGWRRKCREANRLERTIQKGTIIEASECVQFQSGKQARRFQVYSLKPWELAAIEETSGIFFPVRFSKNQMISLLLKDIPETEGFTEPEKAIVKAFEHPKQLELI